MNYVLARCASLAAIGFAIDPAVKGHSLAIGVVIVGCLLYIEAIIDQAVNGE